MELPEGEERNASFKPRSGSPDSTMSGSTFWLASHILFPAFQTLTLPLVSGQDGGKRSRSQSPSTSSDIPSQHVSKRRRIKSISSSDDDAEEDAEATAAIPQTSPTMGKGAKKTPHVPVLSGARSNARAGKKRAGGGAGATSKKVPPTNGAPAVLPKIKVEEDVADAESIAETATTAAEEPAPTMSIDVSINLAQV